MSSFKEQGKYVRMLLICLALRNKEICSYVTNMSGFKEQGKYVGMVLMLWP